MDNPKAAIDALLESTVQAGALTVHPLTVARYALLELVESPLVLFRENNEPLTVLGVIPTIYIMCIDARKLGKYNSKNIEELKGDAFEWAEDAVTGGSVPLVVNMLADKLLDLQRIAPEVVQDSKKKVKDSQATDGSQPSPTGQSQA